MPRHEVITHNVWTEVEDGPPTAYTLVFKAPLPGMPDRVRLTSDEYGALWDAPDDTRYNRACELARKKPPSGGTSND